MAIRSLVTRGFGNGTFAGTVKGLVLRGYEIGDEPPTDPLNYPLLNNVTLTGPDTLQGKLTARDNLSGPGLTGIGTLNGPSIRR